MDAVRPTRTSYTTTQNSAAMASYVVSDADVLLSNMRLTLSIMILMFVSIMVRYDKSANVPRLSKLSLKIRTRKKHSVHKVIHWV